MRSINLLPPEAHVKEQARARVARLALLAVLYLALLVVLTLIWQGRVTEAEQDAAAQQQTNRALEAQLLEFQTVEGLVAEYDANVALMQVALADDLSWGRILNDLGRIIPDSVWLESFRGTVEADPATPQVGAVQVTGVGFDFPDVSAWLRSLDSDRFPAGTSTWVTSVTEGQIGEAEVVNFISQTSLTEAARSDRLDTRIPRTGL
ncbi:PilN domain-containing protein [Actinomycetota bacterium]